MQKKIKSNLALLMAQKKIRSINQLVKETGIRHEALKHLYYENEEYSPSSQTLVKLCDFFGCKLDELLQYDPNDQAS